MAEIPAGTGNASQPAFEQALEQLEAIVRELEEGKITLDEALGRYEKGVKLLRQCYDLLEKAERRIEMLSGIDSEGNPLTTPVDDESLSLDEKAKRRAKRRGSPKSGGSRPHATDVDSTGGLF